MIPSQNQANDKKKNDTSNNMQMPTMSLFFSRDYSDRTNMFLKKK